ncbi:MAG: C40 family peptidase [Nitrosomonas sp.]|nr:C40 family peptidase [Nitrosomonas sp.]
MIDLQKLFINYLFSFIGEPYTYGKHDCSWFAQESLAFFGLDPKGDQNAQMLLENMHIYAKKTPTVGLGHLLFFGTPSRISHVAIALNDTHMIEAGGGNEHTKTAEQALIKGHAYVRVRLISNRNDLVEALKPNGLPW